MSTYDKNQENSVNQSKLGYPDRQSNYFWVYELCVCEDAIKANTKETLTRLICNWYLNWFEDSKHLVFHVCPIFFCINVGEVTNKKRESKYFLFFIFYFLKVDTHVFLKFNIVHILIYPFISDEWALYNNRADTCRQLFNILGGPPLSCSFWSSQILTSS